MQGDNYAEFIYKQNESYRGINYVPCDLGNAFSGNLSLAVTYPKLIEVKKKKTKATSEGSAKGEEESSEEESDGNTMLNLLKNKF